MQITNDEFLTALFGEDKPWVHVTDFPYDPMQIPKEKHLIAWKGDYYSRYNLQPNTNQYFTISTFYADDTGQARRRKALYRTTPVVVLDDVKEKLSMDQVNKLPPPTWILETSQGSEQWGYKLAEPATDRARVENLLDGLVANGLAPDGKDPGMKGVTRYVRLPEGINNKASKLVNGHPFICQMKVWQPFNSVTLEQLAAPFMVDLDAPRRESRVDGAANVPDHPLLQIPDIIHIKEARSDGRFDITCPWVAGHTDNDDSGTAVFTNADYTIGFKCHHGGCDHRTGRDLINSIDDRKPGFSSDLKSWQISKEFSKVGNASKLMSADDGVKDTSWVDEFIVSDEDMKKISEPKWIIENLIIQGHFIVIPAPPNGGKTTIMLSLSGVMVEKGYDVYYVNADVSGADAKPMQALAKDKGFKLLLPDFNAGKSMADVVKRLESMAENSSDYSNLVFIFDTLKKMTDVINKSQSKKLYKTLRSLTAKGMTVICLSHTNKYKGEGNLDVFEGTGDLRSDVDEMIFLSPIKNEDNSMTVSTRPDKVRGTFKPITFNISANREVTQKDVYFDVNKKKAIESQREKDAVIIELVTEVLGNVRLSQSEVVNAVRDKGTSAGEKRIRDVLHRWSQGEYKLWSVEHQIAHNKKLYFLEVSFL